MENVIGVVQGFVLGPKMFTAYDNTNLPGKLLITFNLLGFYFFNVINLYYVHQNYLGLQIPLVN